MVMMAMEKKKEKEKKERRRRRRRRVRRERRERRERRRKGKSRCSDRKDAFQRESHEQCSSSKTMMCPLRIVNLIFLLIYYATSYLSTTILY